MNFKTFGKKGYPTLLLIPGLGVSYEIFLPAGSFGYWQGWLLMAKNPDLLRKRLNVKEKESEQKLL